MSGASGWRRWTRARRAAILAALLPLAATASGCWFQQGADPGNRFYNPHAGDLTAGNVRTLEEVWSAEGAVSAVTHDQVIGAVAGEGHLDVMSRDPATGELLWRRPILGEPVDRGTIGQPPTVVGNADVPGDEIWLGWTAEVTTSAGTRQCYALTSRLDMDGQLIVHFRAQGERADVLVPYGDGSQYEPFPDGGVAAQFSTLRDCQLTPQPQFRVLDSATGTTGWTSPADGPGSRPVLAGEVLADAVGGTLRAFPSDGCGGGFAPCPPIWSFDLGGEGVTQMSGDAHDGFFAGVVGPPVGDGPAAGELVVVDSSSPTLRWRASLPAVPGPMALTPEAVYVASGSQLLAFDADGCGAATCEPLWTATIGEASGDLATAGGVVYVPTSDGRIHALDADADGCGAATCEPITSLTVDTPASSIVLAGGGLFAQTGPTVTAFAPTSPTPPPG